MVDTLAGGLVSHPGPRTRAAITTGLDGCGRVDSGRPRFRARPPAGTRNDHRTCIGSRSARAVRPNAARPRRPHPVPELEAFVDGVVKVATESDHLVGVIVAVVQAGATVLRKGYGFADLRARRRVDPGATQRTMGCSSVADLRREVFPGWKRNIPRRVGKSRADSARPGASRTGEGEPHGSSRWLIHCIRKHSDAAPSSEGERLGAWFSVEGEGPCCIRSP